MKIEGNITNFFAKFGYNRQWSSSDDALTGLEYNDDVNMMSRLQACAHGSETAVRLGLDMRILRGLEELAMFLRRWGR